MSLDSENVAHVVGDRARLAFRFPGADDQVVGEGGQ